MPTAAEIRRRLIAVLGRRTWFPATLPPLEALLAPLLKSGATWPKVTAALDRLRESGLNTPAAFLACRDETWEEFLKPVGRIAQRRTRIRRLLEWVADRGADLTWLATADPVSLRQEILNLRGLGEELVAGVLLAVGHSVIVADLHAHRICKRHGWLPADADSAAIREAWTGSLQSLDEYSEFQALLEELGARYCGPRPLCDGCPLAALLPEGGPCEIDDADGSRSFD